MVKLCGAKVVAATVVVARGTSVVTCGASYRCTCGGRWVRDERRRCQAGWEEHGKQERPHGRAQHGCTPPAESQFLLRLSATSSARCRRACPGRCVGCGQSSWHPLSLGTAHSISHSLDLTYLTLSFMFYNSTGFKEFKTCFKDPHKIYQPRFGRSSSRLQYHHHNYHLGPSASLSS